MSTAPDKSIAPPVASVAELSSVATQATQALQAALASRGFALDDFRLHIDSASTWSQWFGVSGGLIKVRCRSTREERLYPLGSGSAWLGAFTTDLVGGHFASARRRREPAPRALQRSLLQRVREAGRGLQRLVDGGRALAFTSPR
ncbi:MAG: hypothetical protein ABIS28_17205 [Caldimonas sp.]